MFGDMDEDEDEAPVSLEPSSGEDDEDAKGTPEDPEPCLRADATPPSSPSVSSDEAVLLRPGR